MKLIHKAMAGTMESSDIMVTIEPKEEGGIELELTSSVMQQFGRQIEAVIRETLKGLGVAETSIQTTEFYIYPEGYISNGIVYNTGGLRPAVSLKPGTPVIGGDGTVISPYLIR